MAKKNRYIKKARMAQVLKALKGEANPSGDALAATAVTVKDLVVGVVGGGVLAAVAGNYAIPLGLIITGTGHYKNNTHLQALGIGTMASNSFTKTGTVSGLDGLDGVKERLQALKGSLSDKFFLNKILKKKAVNGFGEVQYFNYQDSSTVGELAALDNIENQLLESGMQFQGAEEFEGVEGLDDYSLMGEDPLY